MVWPLGRELHLWTWQVLRGLRALNIDMNQPWLLKARDWLESVQRTDGAGASVATRTMIRVQRPRPEHRVTNRVGRDGLMRV